MKLILLAALGWLALRHINYLYRRSHWMSDEKFWPWYRDYMQTPHWERIRKVTLFFRFCWYCWGTKETLQMHHLNYKHLYFEIPFVDVRPACVSCHDRITIAGRRRKR